MKDLVSIVVTMYNKEEYVRDCLHSIVNQSYSPFEVIIVDDCSTDDSFAVAEDFMANHGRGITRFIRSDRNEGQTHKSGAASRNIGIAASRGEFILPVDADDFIDTTYLDKTLPLMAHPWVGIVATDMQRFGGQNDLIRVTRRTLKEQLESNQLPITSLIRRRAFDMVPGGYWPYGWEDWNLWIDLLRKGWCVDTVNEPLFHYRVTAGGLNTDQTNDRAALIERMRERHKDFKGR